MLSVSPNNYLSARIHNFAFIMLFLGKTKYFRRFNQNKSSAILFFYRIFSKLEEKTNRRFSHDKKHIFKLFL